MSATINTLILLAIALLTARVLAWLLLSVWKRIVSKRQQLSRWSPLVVAAPPLVGIAVAMAVHLPANPVAHAIHGPYERLDHDGWLHLSSLATAQSWPLVAMAMAVVLVIGIPLIRRWLAVARGCLIAHRMLPPSKGPQAVPALSDLPTPNAVVAGLLRPRIVADRQWWASLSDDDRRLVLAHEDAHLHRRDPLTLAVLLVLGAFAPAAAIAGVRTAWENYAELCADSAAATEIGDPLAVAEALLKHHRSSSLIPGFTTAWTGGRLETRVRALLDQPGNHSRPKPDVDGVLLAYMTLMGAAILSTAPEIHQLVELFINEML